MTITPVSPPPGRTAPPAGPDGDSGSGDLFAGLLHGSACRRTGDSAGRTRPPAERITRSHGSESGHPDPRTERAEHTGSRPGHEAGSGVGTTGPAGGADEHPDVPDDVPTGASADRAASGPAVDDDGQAPAPAPDRTGAEPVPAAFALTGVDLACQLSGFGPGTQAPAAQEAAAAGQAGPAQSARTQSGSAGVRAAAGQARPGSLPGSSAGTEPTTGPAAGSAASDAPAQVDTARLALLRGRSVLDGAVGGPRPAPHHDRTDAPSTGGASADAPVTAVPSDGTAAVTAAVPADGTGGRQAGGGDSSGSHPGQPGADQALAAPASVSGPAPAPAPARVDASATAATSVTGQVFPEVTRLVSRGDGTRRITLALSPEALGDVRVVLTVRQGEVHVRLAGSEAAQRAMITGAPELHRLLDQAGATSSQVVVGDQTSTAGQGGAGTFRDQLGAQDGAPQGHGRDTDHRNAGTRAGDTSARDGAAGGTRPRHPTDPGTRPRLTGVDVTM